MTTIKSGLPLAVTTLLVALAVTSPARADESAANLSQLETLGQRIFEDTNLSEPKGQACASCHEASRGFTGNAGSPVAAVARGSVAASLGERNVPTIMYMSFSPPFAFAAEKNDEGVTEYTPTGGFFWDGRASSLAEQAKGPLLNPVEMNNPSEDSIAAKIRRAAYAPEFTAIFGDGALKDTPTIMANLASALAAFESGERFQPFTSRFDDFLLGKSKLTAAEQRGFALFKDAEKGNCIACHVGDKASKKPQDWLFTDFTYDALGAPRNATIPANADAAHSDLGLCTQPGLDKLLPKDVEKDSLCGAFKVPTLRNIAATAPYFHNGSFTALRDVVSFYATRDADPQRWYGKVAKFNDLPPQYHGNINTGEAPYGVKPGEKPRLDEAEIDDLVAFLRTLTDRGVTAD